MYKKFGFIAYSWLTTLLFAGVIYWLATIANFDVTTDITNEVVKVLFRMIMYAFLVVLIYRSLIATFRMTVTRLSSWRSKGEAAEDAEFVLIIETLLVIISVLSSILYAVFEQYVQMQIAGRTESLNDMLKDVLVSIMASLLAALVVYTIPSTGELEMAVKHYYQRRKKQKTSKKKK